MAHQGHQYFSIRSHFQEPQPRAMTVNPHQSHYGTQVLPRHAESGFHADYYIDQLHQELEETKKQLAKQKELKEKCINDNKELKRELERLQKYAHPQVLSAAKISNQVQSAIKQRKKKDLQRDYEELKVAYVTNEAKFSKDLEAERQKNNILQQELQGLRQQLDSKTQESKSETFLKKEVQDLKAAQEDLASKSDAQISAAKTEVKALRQELEHERLVCSQELLQQQQIINSLKAEQDFALQAVAKQIATMTVASCRRELCFQAELHCLKVQLKDSRMDQLLKENCAQQQPLVPVVTVIQTTEETQNVDSAQETTQLSEPEGLQGTKEDPEDVPEPKKKSPSFWKRARRFLRLKKSTKNKN
ncbi:transcription factor SPT20 homolog [Oryzias melastigma]|uniref:transcription factor SPT20 homolog n=1 Tax=Oryzias melastigma TaxID=30732 RepID=UPI000CF7E637|nr:transcription factor SPT20 homolog [Oryzias melastigma]